MLTTLIVTLVTSIVCYAIGYMQGETKATRRFNEQLKKLQESYQVMLNEVKSFKGRYS